MANPYLPIPVTISEVITETTARDIKSFELKFRDESDADNFSYTCGQFAEICIFGAGESPIGIASSPMDKGILQFTVKKAGRVTNSISRQDLLPCRWLSRLLCCCLYIFVLNIFLAVLKD